MVLRPEDTLDRVGYIGGETVSYGQLADTLDEALKTRFSREEWSLGFLRERLSKNRGNLWYKYQCIFGDGVGISWELNKTLNGQRGIHMTTAKDYIQATYGHVKGTWINASREKTNDMSLKGVVRDTKYCSNVYYSAAGGIKPPVLPTNTKPPLTSPISSSPHRTFQLEHEVTPQIPSPGWLPSPRQCAP